MVKRCRRKNAFQCSEKLGILRKRQPPHQHCARVDLLMRRLRRKLGKEIHRPNLILPQRRTKSEDNFDSFRPAANSLTRNAGSGANLLHPFYFPVPPFLNLDLRPPDPAASTP